MTHLQVITILFSKRPLQIRDTLVLWVSAVRYLGLVLDSKRLHTQHVPTVANKTTVLLSNIFPSRFSTHTVQQVDPLQITHSIHPNLRHPCLQFHTSLQLPQTPSHPFRVPPSHR